MQIARDPLNFQALAIEEAEGKIRETVQKDYFDGKRWCV